jgi:hypothetical protein
MPKAGANSLNTEENFGITTKGVPIEDSFSAACRHPSLPDRAQIVRKSARAKC